jgi:energy-coupling factor transporter transmembrane protein EcfT
VSVRQAFILLVIIMMFFAAGLVIGAIVWAISFWLFLTLFGTGGCIGLTVLWFVYQHHLENLRTKRAVRQFHEEKKAALAHAKKTKANYKVGADHSLEVIHWRAARQGTTEVEEEEAAGIEHRLIV